VAMARQDDVNTAKNTKPSNPARAPIFPPIVDESCTRDERRRYKTTASQPLPSIHKGKSVLMTGSIEATAITSPAVLAEGKACLQLIKEPGFCVSASEVTDWALPAAEVEAVASGTRT